MAVVDHYVLFDIHDLSLRPLHERAHLVHAAKEKKAGACSTSRIE
jgi:hypothetical protein